MENFSLANNDEIWRPFKPRWTATLAADTFDTRRRPQIAASASGLASCKGETTTMGCNAFEYAASGETLNKLSSCRTHKKLAVTVDDFLLGAIPWGLTSASLASVRMVSQVYFFSYFYNCE
jgi:hypothetical protein